MTAAAVNRQSVIIDGRQVPMHNGTVTKQRGSSAASDNSIPAVPQRARPNQPLKNPLAHYPPVPPIPSLPQSLAGQARKSVERQVPGFDLNNPQPQSSSFTSRTRYAVSITLSNVAEKKAKVANKMPGSHLRAPTAHPITFPLKTALEHPQGHTTTNLCLESSYNRLI